MSSGEENICKGKAGVSSLANFHLKLKPVSHGHTCLTDACMSPSTQPHALERTLSSIPWSRSQGLDQGDKSTEILPSK